MTDDEIHAQIKVCEAATEGPWESHNYPWLISGATHWRENRILCTHARAHYAEVLRELLEARKWIAELERALKSK